jgi:hypothetical protein
MQTLTLSKAQFALKGIHNKSYFEIYMFAGRMPQLGAFLVFA